jgi:hypothetical protein
MSITRPPVDGRQLAKKSRVLAAAGNAVRDAVDAPRGLDDQLGPDVAGRIDTVAEHHDERSPGFGIVLWPIATVARYQSRTKASRVGSGVT